MVDQVILGHKNWQIKKSDGSRSHFFANLIEIYHKDDYSSNLEINYQHVSNDTYLKVHDIKTELADKGNNIITKVSYEFKMIKII